MLMSVGWSLDMHLPLQSLALEVMANIPQSSRLIGLTPISHKEMIFLPSVLFSFQFSLYVLLLSPFLLSSSPVLHLISMLVSIIQPVPGLSVIETDVSGDSADEPDPTVGIQEGHGGGCLLCCTGAEMRMQLTNKNSAALRCQ